MKIKNQYDYQFPSYALNALFNGDLDGLDNDDIANFERFMEQNKNIDIWEDKDPDSEPYFTHYPEFGLACNVVDLVGIEFEKEEN
jgi:hypothetical protein